MGNCAGKKSGKNANANNDIIDIDTNHDNNNKNNNEKLDECINNKQQPENEAADLHSNDINKTISENQNQEPLPVEIADEVKPYNATTEPLKND